MQSDCSFDVRILGYQLDGVIHRVDALNPCIICLQRRMMRHQAILEINPASSERNSNWDWRNTERDYIPWHQCVRWTF